MVEFPLVARRGRGLRRRFENLSQIPPFADINFTSSNRCLGLSGMWEISTGLASFHARLNVAPRAVSDKAGIEPLGRPVASNYHKFRNTAAGFWFKARKC